eukprot:m.297646 g.297646  ORF g.297646 m.297646 type:complete len:53 (-) comp273072_c0_seq1:27-185(-)
MGALVSPWLANVFPNCPTPTNGLEQTTLKKGLACVFEFLSRTHELHPTAHNL